MPSSVSGSACSHYTSRMMIWKRCSPRRIHNAPSACACCATGEMEEVLVEPAPLEGEDSHENSSLQRLGLLQDVAGELATAVYSVARSSPTEYRAHLVLEFEEVPAEELPKEPVPGTPPPE